LRRAGAIILGKTNTSELTLGGEMENVIYGATFNPYDLSKSPGGSSGGAGAIIAAGGSPLDLGSDTGGSIREPAHMCGIVGIKPTFGRVPRTGHAISFGAGIVDILTQIGPMARYVEDLRLALPLICGPDWQDPTVVSMVLGDPAVVRLENLHIALYTDGGLSSSDPVISETVLATGKALAEAGAAVEEQAPVVLKRAPELYQWLHFIDRGRWLRRLLQQAGTSKPGPHIARLLEEAESANVPDLSMVLEEINHFRTKMLQFISRFDAIVCPVETYPAAPHGVTEKPGKHDDWGHMYAYNLTGWPAAVVRSGTTAQGLPIGVQVVGQPWREDVVFAILQVIETTFGGYQPPKAYS
jgi:amidase